MSKRACLLLLLVWPFFSRAADAPAASPSPSPSASPSASPAAAGQDTPLADVKASVQLPQGWFVKKDVDEGVTVYQFSREKIATENGTFTAGIILTVTTKVPDRAQMKPSEYAAQLLASTQDDSSDSLKKTVDGPWQIFRADYKIDADTGGIHVINLAKANDKTGTLYFITWQSPVTEEDKLAPIREATLSSFKFDPSF